MKIKTRKFGDIDIADDKIIQMPFGLPGFPGRNRYVLLEINETRPFCWYQCVDDPDLVLAVMNPLLFKPDYRVNLQSILKEMAWHGDSMESMAVYVVVTINKGGLHRITANLMGPIVINTVKCNAVQLIMNDSPYSHQHPIMKPPENNAPQEKVASA